ncbi:MAG: hypothetical protein R8K48_10495 [Gallionella sp.]
MRQTFPWVSPLARAVLKLKVGDVSRLKTPVGIAELAVLPVANQTLA